MTGLGPVIHGFRAVGDSKSWMAGSSPAMTMRLPSDGEPLHQRSPTVQDRQYRITFRGRQTDHHARHAKVAVPVSYTHLTLPTIYSV